MNPYNVEDFTINMSTILYLFEKALLIETNKNILIVQKIKSPDLKPQKWIFRKSQLWTKYLSHLIVTFPLICPLKSAYILMDSSF